MIIFEDINPLCEAFDRPAPYKWDSMYNEARFTVGNVQYVAFIKDNDTARGLSLYVAFQRRDNATGQWTHSLAKGSPKDAMTVLSTILAATFDKASKVEPNEITFSAFRDADDEDANKRFRLYKRMAERYAKQMNYTVHITGNSFTLTNNNPPKIRRLHNDGIHKEDELTYVNFPACNAFTWAKIFWLDNDGDYIKLTLPHGRIHIVRKSSDVIEIEAITPKGRFDNLDSDEIWMSMLSDIKVKARGGRTFTISEKGAILDAGDMILCEQGTFYYLSSEDDFKEIWGYEIDSIE
ncbi:hypothetical protein pp2_056 [Vibrio phage phi-pp2]|uniref:Uncharacterized protein n=1 Tax=Vibrio phage phi-pp2 TaxID=1204514 RepID=I6XGK7_9CAUD|nr:hypothetical protein pp2_056 [Vibrio phage phi-pp2]